MSTTMPAFVALREENGEKFLGYLTEGDQMGYLGFCLDEIFEPRAKFAVESGPDGLVHIRCCYNNKYWIRASATEDYITPAASEAELDREKWNCTLFEPLLTSKESVLNVAFIHKQTGCRLVAMENPKVINGYVLSIGPSSLEDDIDLNAKPCLRVMDFGSVVKLPRYVAFKGENGKFLTTTRSINHVTYHHTFVAEDEHDPNSRYEILYTKSGNIHVRSVSANIFWRFNKLSSKMLGKDHTFHTAKACEIEVLQRPDQPNKVCLRIARNRNYLGSRLSMKRTTKHALLPIGEAFKSATLLEVVEPIVHRRIDRMQFRLEHARIYDQTPVTVFNAEIPNVTDQEHLHAAEVSYTVTKSSSWNNGFTLTSGVKTTFETGFPCIADGMFEVHAQISKEYKWGECVQTSEHVKSIYTVPVVAKMKTIIRVLGSKAKWEIPFSYVQTDTLQDMKKQTTRFDDGVYIGVLAYDFLHKTHYEPL